MADDGRRVDPDRLANGRTQAGCLEGDQNLRRSTVHQRISIVLPSTVPRSARILSFSMVEA
jgi:hypothetical protein